VARFGIDWCRWRRARSPLRADERAAARPIDLDRLLAALSAELTRAAARTQVDFEQRLAARGRRVLPERLQRALGADLAEAVEALQPTLVPRVAELRIEAAVQLLAPLEAAQARDRPVLLRVVATAPRARREAAALCIRLDATAGGEVRIGSFTATVVAGRRTGAWQSWDAQRVPGGDNGKY
jgi:hypothetical protein